MSRRRFFSSAAVAILLISLPSLASAQQIIGGLLGNDLTDIGNNGVEGSYAPPNLAGFDAVFFGNDEPNFNPPNNEGAFNVFDNLTGGGQNKWCCNGPNNTGEAPIFVGADFGANPANAANPYVTLTHFTATSSNDTPGRDSINWEIQGSNDGITWTTIFDYDQPTAVWTARNQTRRFNLGTAFSLSNPYSRLRYISFDQGNNNHALSELEFFGVQGSLETVTDIQVAGFSGDHNAPPQVSATFAASTMQAYVGLDTAVISEDLSGTDPAQILMRVVGVNGPEEISIDKAVLNSTGLDWTSFEVMIEENLNPAQSTGAAGDPTFTAALDDAGFFADVEVNPSNVLFSDGLLPDGSQGDFRLAISIPGANSIDPVTGLASYEFFITQQAASVVPEPASIAIWALIGLGLVGFGFQRLKRKK